MSRSKSKSNQSNGIVVLFVVFVVMVMGFVWSTTNPDRAHRILEEEGYENVEVGGYAWFACTGSSTWANSFDATREGHPVSGAVCCSFMTCEVRLY